MNKGGIGVGSASIVLVFAVLCLTIFSLISLSAASGDKALVDAEVRMVEAYYEADTLAERILAEILETDFIPETILGVDITTAWEAEATRAIFSCPVSDRKELYVEVVVYGDSYDILKWRMQDIALWEIDTSIPVWLG